MPVTLFCGVFEFGVTSHVTYLGINISRKLVTEENNVMARGPVCWDMYTAALDGSTASKIRVDE
jgi:hypothetical protein